MQDPMDAEVDRTASYRLPGLRFIDKTMEQIEEEIRQSRPDPRGKIVTFVDLFQEAHQIYHLRKYLKNQCSFLKADSRRFDVLVELARQPVMKQFNLIDPQIISYAIDERILKRKIKERGYPSFLKIYERGGRKHVMRFRSLAGKGAYESEVTDPIYQLVCRSHKGVPLSKDPQLELDKIETSHLRFYQDKFVALKLDRKYEGRCVTVTDVLDDDSCKLLEILEECGELESTEMTSWKEPDRKVTATYKTPEIARIAAHLLGSRMNAKRDLQPYRRKSFEEMSKILAEALGRYEVLWNFYSELSKPKEGEDRVSVSALLHPHEDVEQLEEVATVASGVDRQKKHVTKKSSRRRNRNRG